MNYEFWINSNGNLILWENLTLEEAETLEQLTVKLNHKCWKSSGWDKIIKPIPYERISWSIDND
jgi:lysophospholipid acyltransferase (LPLAT)-like uncharacterized protein